MDLSVKDVVPQAIHGYNYDLLYSLVAQNSFSDINEKCLIDMTEASLLYFAVEAENIELVQLLVCIPEVDVNTTSIIYFFDDKDGKKRMKKQRTVLSIAAENGDIDILQCLLSRDEIDVNAKDSIVQEYIYDVYYEEKQFDLEYKEIKHTALYIALKNGNDIVANLLLQKPGIDVNYQYGYYWHSPSHGEHKHEITAITTAIENGEIDIVRILLSKSDLDINLTSSFDEGKNVKSSLMSAIEKGNLEIVRLLLENPNIKLPHITQSGFHIDNYSNSQREWQEKSELYTAVEKGDAQIVRLLLNHPKIDPNYKYSYENFEDEFREEDQIQGCPSRFRGFESYTYSTVLTLAIEKNMTSVVSALVESSRVDVNINKTESHHEFFNHNRSSYEQSPLWLAVLNQNSEIVRILLQRPEIDRNFVSSSLEFDNTALDLAKIKRNTEIIQLLSQQ